MVITNTPKGGLLIKKMDSVTKEPLSDVTFKVTTADGAVVGTSNGEYRTDSNGYISIPDLEPGTYIVQEVQTKSGYLLDDTPKTITVKDHQTYTLEVFNQPKGGLIINKLDSVTHEPLEGVEFTITEADGTVVDDNGGMTSSMGLYRTDKNGQIIIEDQTSSADVNQAKLRIYKVDAENYTDLLPGAAFEIYRFEQTDDGGYDWIQTILTAQGEDGQYIVGETGYIELNFVEHLTAGSLYNTLYRLNEITAPTGYTASDETYYFVWMEQSATEESTIAAMTETGAVPENFSFETANVVFIPYSTDSAIYVPNESSTTFISVTKQWQGAEGTALEEGEHPDEVKVTLYQVSNAGTKTEYKAEGVENPVKLNAGNGWTYTWEQLPKEDAQGDAVTYTVEETPIEGWDVSYTYPDGANENTGVAEGEIIVINRERSTFTLPEQTS